MYQIKVHNLMNQIVSCLYRVKFWSRYEEDSVWERRIKIFVSIYYSLFPISLVAGAFTSDNKDEQIFLVQLSLMVIVVSLKLFFLIWRKKEILELLSRACVYSIVEYKTFSSINRKLEILMKFVAVYLSVSCLTVICSTLVAPFVGRERTLFLHIGFPFNWKNNEFAYWAAFSFISTQMFIATFDILFPVFIWYFMFHCALNYVVLGEKIRNLGAITSDERPESDTGNSYAFRRGLHKAIVEHQNLIKLTNQLGAFANEMFAVQVATSGLCICGSIYCLAFNKGDNLVELIVNLALFVYNIFDVFMVMYFGNEIKLGSDRISYSLFESNWVDLPQSIKAEIIIFGEFQMKPQELMILKLYPLTLDTFTRILESAYSMFNILKNFK